MNIAPDVPFLSFFIIFNYFYNFDCASCKAQPCIVSTNLVKWFRRSCLKNLLTDGRTDGGRHKMDQHKSSHWEHCPQVSLKGRLMVIAGNGKLVTSCLRTITTVVTYMLYCGQGIIRHISNEQLYKKTELMSVGH